VSAPPPGPVVIDPAHWLYRLSPEDWLRAADKELALAYSALAGKHRREGLTYARRAGGMALNAVLWSAPSDAWGRSYVDHLRALAADAGAPGEVRTAADALMSAAMTSNLVSLGPGPTDLADAARTVIAWARARVSAAAGETG